MEYYVLASGSSGNCSIVKSDNCSVIIDCGCTGKYLKDCFTKIGFDYQKADGLLITHSHSDHIKQIKMFENLDVYSPFAVKGIYREHLIFPYKSFQINDLIILPIELSHDCDICVGYIISDGKEVLVQVSDTGIISKTNYQLIKNADYYIFESNHDEDLLLQTNRPYSLCKRILSDHGHMSNNYASDVLKEIVSGRTKEVILSHISKEANRYDLAYQTTRDKLNEKIFVKAIKQFEIYHGGSKV